MYVFQVFLGDRRLSMLSVSEMVDVLDFDFDMEDGEKVAYHYDTTSLVVCGINIFKTYVPSLGCLLL